MKKMLFFAVVFAVALVLSNVSFAQDDQVDASVQGAPMAAPEVVGEDAIQLEGVAQGSFDLGQCGMPMPGRPCPFRPFLRRACNPCFAAPCGGAPCGTAPCYAPCGFQQPACPDYNNIRQPAGSRLNHRDSVVH